MSNLLSGLTSLSYQGTNAPNPPNVTRQRRDPNFQDWQNFSLMDEWLNTDTREAWILVSLAGNRATWVQFTGGTGSLIDLTGDTGTAVPTGGSIKIAGGLNINTAAAASTVTVNLDTTLTGLTSLTTDNLVVTTSETFSNLGRGVVQSSNTGVLSASEGTNGQVLISSSTGAPAWANITAGSNITITNGANSIEIASTGGGGGGGSGPTSIIYTSAALSLGDVGGIIYLWASNAGNVEALHQGIVPVAGTISKLYVDAIANNSTTDGVVTLKVNGSPTALTTTISALTTGTFTDLTHSISVNAGDLITFEAAQATTGNITGTISVAFSATGGGGGGGSGSSIIGAFSGSNLANSAIDLYSPLFNLGLSSATNTSKSPVAGTINNLYVGVLENASTTDNTITLNVNGVDTALTITIPALTVGEYSDLTHSVAVSQGDRICFHSTGATTGGIQGSLTAAFSATGGTGSSGLTLLQTQTFTNVTQGVFNTGITTTYNDYLLKINQLSYAATGVGSFFALQISEDGGSTYKNSGYIGGGGIAVPTNMALLGNIGPIASANQSIELQNFTSGLLYPTASGSSGTSWDGTSPTTGSASGTNGMYITSTIVVNAFRLFISSGGTFSCTASLYGYSK